MRAPRGTAVASTAQFAAVAGLVGCLLRVVKGVRSWPAARSRRSSAAPARAPAAPHRQGTGIRGTRGQPCPGPASGAAQRVATTRAGASGTAPGQPLPHQQGGNRSPAHAWRGQGLAIRQPPATSTSRAAAMRQQGGTRSASDGGGGASNRSRQGRGGRPSRQGLLRTPTGGDPRAPRWGTPPHHATQKWEAG